jgi:hypothetical protein
MEKECIIVARFSLCLQEVKQTRRCDSIGSVFTGAAEGYKVPFTCNSSVTLAKEN